jgi:hypothetical protein
MYKLPTLAAEGLQKVMITLPVIKDSKEPVFIYDKKAKKTRKRG